MSITTPETVPAWIPSVTIDVALYRDGHIGAEQLAVLKAIIRIKPIPPRRWQDKHNVYPEHPENSLDGTKTI
jgi:hypothetical protein